MENPTTIELGDNDSIIITKNGKVVGFVEARERFGKMELCANPVIFYNWMINSETHVFNSFSTTGATNVDSPEQLASVENFLNYMNKKAVA